VTRRLFLFMPAIATAAPDPDTPRNRLAGAANAHREQYALWAEAVNAAPPGGFHAPAAAAWEPLPQLWRKLEKAWDKLLWSLSTRGT
jgi:hypothetical protein